MDVTSGLRNRNDKNVSQALGSVHAVVNVSEEFYIPLEEMNFKLLDNGIVLLHNANQGIKSFHFSVNNIAIVHKSIISVGNV